MSGNVLRSAPPVHRFVLLTDIAHSSKLAEQYPREYMAALDRHNQLVEDATERRGGLAYKQVGDGYFVLFETAGACLGAASELGAAFGTIEPLAEDAPIRVRIALHAGTLQPSGREYYGPALNRVSRICQVCHPGQILLSGALVADSSGNDGAFGETVLADPAGKDSGLKLLDLGLHHLRDLAEPEQLFQLDCESFGRHDFPPLATLDNRPNNLVSQPNRFIGREQELGELSELLQGDTHLLSIVAPGGYGKSRLASQLCANLLNRFGNGVFMVYLAPVRESLSVPTAIANALGMQFGGGATPEQQICAYLREKELLLCLDNCEHLPDSASLVSQLLAAAPKLKVLTTSREPMRVQGEQTFALEPLPLSAGNGQFSEAELLFADRAALVNRGFALTPDNSAEVRHFCEHMAGIPLAIELAAAWMDSFTLAELHDELTHQLELEARASDRPERHQSLKASLDWSWNLLGKEQQEILMRLSTFRGGFFSEAAAAVLGIKGMALRAVLSRLCDKSWLYTREVDNQTRFFMRDMLAHEYAFAKLIDTRGAVGSLFEQAVGAHAAYYAALVEREGPRLSGGGAADSGATQKLALRTWHRELENINAALDSALQRGEVRWLLPIAQYLRVYLEQTSASFVQRDRYMLLLEAANSLGEPVLLGQSQLGLGRAQLRLGDGKSAHELFAQSLENLHEVGDRRGEARSLQSLALIHHFQGESAQAADLYRQSLAICREIGDRQGEAGSLANRGLLHLALGEHAQAAELLSQALEISSEIGDRLGEANSLNNLANVLKEQGEFDRAAELYSKGALIFCEIGNRLGEANANGNLALVYLEQGKYAQATELLNQTLAIRRELGDRYGMSNSLANLSHLYRVQGNNAQAADLLNQSLAIWRETGNRHGEASALLNLGSIRFAQGEYDATREHLEQSRAICLEIGDRRVEAYCLVLLAAVLQMQGAYAQATLHYGRALAIRRELGAKPELALTCALSAASMAALQAFRPAAILLYGGEFLRASLNNHSDPEVRLLLDTAQTSLDAAVTSGEISAEQFAAWKAEGEALSLDELAKFAQAELAKVKVASHEGGTAG